MAQTLTGYILSKATNKRPQSSKSSSGSAQTLTGFAIDKFLNKENQQKLGFLGELQQQFKILGTKTDNIKNISAYQVKLQKEILLEEGDIASRVGRIQELLVERAELETQYFERAIQRRKQDTQIDVWMPENPVTEQPQNPPEMEDNVDNITPDNISLPPMKQASGGIQNNAINAPAKKREEKKLAINFAGTMNLVMQTSGMSAISVIGDMLKAAGPISALVLPFVNSVLKPFATALGVSADFVSRLLIAPVRAEETELYKRQAEFTKTWGNFLNDENFIAKFIDRSIDAIEGIIQDPNLQAPILTGDLAKKSKQFAEYLMTKHGLKDFQAAAIVGTMIFEGFGSGKPDVREGSQRGAPTYDGSSTQGYGWLQWTNTQGGGPNDRLNRALIHLGMGPPKQTRPWTDADNISVMEYEWKNHYKKTLPAIKSATTLEQAVYEFVGNYTAGSHANISTYEQREKRYGHSFIGNRNSAASGVMRLLKGENVKSDELTRRAKLESGGVITATQNLPFQNMIVSGSEAGYKTQIAGTPVTLHGTELVRQTPQGFQVFPIKNKKYNIAENPTKVLDRWKSIASGSSSKVVNIMAESGISLGVKAIQHDEALSSLSRGGNDYIVQNGHSVISSTPWKKIKPNTSIHAYETGVSGDRTTIGWGMTYYDSITAGRKAVKPGQTITKSKADSLLAGLVQNYVKTLSSQKWYKMFWNKMSPSQQAGLLAYGYNQPAHLLGTGAPKMYAALNRGDMRGVAANIDRGLPQREKNEKRLVLSGPTDLTKAKARGTQTKPKVRNLTIPGTNIPIPFTTASASSTIMTEEYDGRKAEYEMYLTRLG